MAKFIVKEERDIVLTQYQVHGTDEVSWLKLAGIFWVFSCIEGLGVLCCVTVSDLSGELHGYFAW